MSNLAIVRPLPIAAIGGTFEGAARLRTPDPKEAAITTGGNKTIDIDLGSVQQFDTLFLGYTSGNDASSVNITYGAASYTTSGPILVPIGASSLFSPRRHFLYSFPAPVSARYIRVTANPTFSADYSIGVAVVGLAFRPIWGHEVGAGRPIIDTGSAERLFGGGFGINEGVRASGWQWTLGDLQPDELVTLFAIVMDRGTTRSVLVVEDPDPGAGLSERCHWGLFQKLEPYERLAPQDTRWNFVIGDWA